MSEKKKKSENNKNEFSNALTQAIQKYIDSGKATECFNLSCMARALNIANQRVYVAAKTPIPGVLYDPKEYNWDALERFVLRRLDPNETMDEFVERVYGIQEELKNAPHPSGRDKRIHIPQADGSEVVYPGRRGDVAVCEGAVLKLKDDPAVYTVALVSPTHVVLTKEGTPELFLLSNWTYNARVDRESIVFPMTGGKDEETPKPVDEAPAGVVVEQ